MTKFIWVLCAICSLGHAVTLKVSVLSIFEPRLVRITLQENGQPSEVRLLDASRLEKDGKIFSEITFQSSYPIKVEIPGRITRSYAGSLTLSSHQNKLLLVNHISVEKYLDSVVYAEMGKAHPEMYRVQAILARTKALERARERFREPFFLTDLTDSQAYKGFSHTTAQVKKAVLDTRDLVLTHKDQLATVYYSSTCAGATTTPVLVWGSHEEGFSPVSCRLQGQSLCGNSPHFKIWEWRVEARKLRLMLGLDRLDSIKVKERDPSGRALWLEITGSENRRMRGENFRIQVGRFFRQWGLLKSSLFFLEQEGNVYIFKGRGLGHGVGLCQFGAQELARRGFGYEKILSFYFPLLSIKKYQFTRMEHD